MLNIAIIDNDLEVVDFVEEVILNTAGLENALVGRASNQQEAYSLLQAQAFNLIIMEINLPDGNGLSLLEAFRTANMTAPVIVCSGSLTSEMLAQLRQLNVGATLFKPISAENVQKAITAVLNPRT